MKLYSRRVVRSLRERVAAEVSASKTMKAEQRDARKRRSRHLPPWTFHILVWVGIVAIGIYSTAYLLHALAIWPAVVMLLRAGDVRSALEGGNAEVFAQFPVSDEWVFRYSRDEIVRRSAWLAMACLLGYGLLARQTGSGAVAWSLVIPCAVLQAACAVAFPLALRVWLPRLWYFPVVAGALLPLLVAAFLHDRMPDLSHALIGPSLWFYEHLTPGGWITQAFSVALPGHDVWRLTLLLPALLAVGVLPLSFRAVRREFRFWQSEAAVPRVIHDDDEEEFTHEPPVHPMRASDAAEAVLSRAFLDPARSQRLWIEQWAVRVLNPRERRLLAGCFCRHDGRGTGFSGRSSRSPLWRRSGSQRHSTTGSCGCSATHFSCSQSA